MMVSFYHKDHDVRTTKGHKVFFSLIFVKSSRPLWLKITPCPIDFKMRCKKEGLQGLHILGLQLLYIVVNQQIV